MMVSDQSDWIKRDLGFEEHLADDPFHATLIARYDYQDRKLDDRFALLEEIIKVLRREIKELNHELKNYRGLDLSYE